MNQVSKLGRLANLSYFDRTTVSQFVNVSDNSLYANIKRWLKRGNLIQLKKGLYVTKEYYAVQNKEVYAEFIANKLREPSYLSTEYILQRYSMLAEAVYAITSITLKARMTYTNALGTFIYRNIKEDLFCGFKIDSRNGFEIKEASKAKALFDYLYLKTYRVKDVDKDLLDSFRLNFDEFTADDLSEFSHYCEMTGIKKYSALPCLIGELCDL